jgi:hypothetical protein
MMQPLTRQRFFVALLMFVEKKFGLSSKNDAPNTFQKIRKYSHADYFL